MSLCFARSRLAFAAMRCCLSAIYGRAILSPIRLQGTLQGLVPIPAMLAASSIIGLRGLFVSANAPLVASLNPFLF